MVFFKLLYAYIISPSRTNIYYTRDLLWIYDILAKLNNNKSIYILTYKK